MTTTDKIVACVGCCFAAMIPALKVWLMITASELTEMQAFRAYWWVWLLAGAGVITSALWVRRREL